MEDGDLTADETRDPDNAGPGDHEAKVVPFVADEGEEDVAEEEKEVEGAEDSGEHFAGRERIE